MDKVAALFPGQGSQVVGMGLDLWESSDTAKSIFERADSALGFALSELCFKGPIEELTKTEFAQPALLTVSYICYLEFAKNHIPISCSAGHSLGEYSALVSAGALNFEDALVLVNKRGRYMQQAVPTGKGSMLAVMGPSEQEIREALAKVSEGVAEIANLNSPGQTVIAGDMEGLAACAEIIKGLGAKVIPLNVSAPFHCSLMKPAAEKLAVDLDAISFSEPEFPIYANVTAEKIDSPDKARQLLKDQVCSSVRWTDSIVNIKQAESVSKMIEFGPGAVLSKLLKRIDREITSHQVSDKASLDKTLSSL